MGGGLGGVLGAEDRERTPFSQRPPPSPPSLLAPQLKVPAEDPASELAISELEAWKAAEKVRAVHRLQSVSRTGWSTPYQLTPLSSPTESPLGPAGPHPGCGGLRGPDDSALSLGIRRLTPLWAQPASCPLL